MTRERSPFKQSLILLGAISALVAVSPLLLSSGDFGDFIMFLLSASGVSVFVLVVAIVLARRQGPASLTMLLTYAAMSLGLFHFSQALHDNCRWLFEGGRYKEKVMALPPPADGSLRHVEWDGWGGPGAGDTTVYLVFDPQDLLTGTTSSNQSKRLPCDVSRIQRRGARWYEVTFYTDTDWDHCQ